MASFRFEIKKDNAKAGKPVKIRLRIAHNFNGKQQRRFVPTPFKTTVRNWSQTKQLVKKGAKDHAQINKYLAEVKQICADALLQFDMDGRTVTAEALAEMIVNKLSGGPDDSDFIGYARRQVKNYERENKLATADRLTVILNKLETFRNPVTFDDLTPAFIRRYMNHLRDEYGNNTNTVNKNITGLRTLYYSAIRDGLVPQSQNPFFAVKLKGEKVLKRKLSPEQIEAIQSLDLDPGSGQDKARDYFLFSMYAGGLRFGDVAMLKWSNLEGDRLVFRTQKTKDPRSVLLVDSAKAILDKYVGRRGKSEFIFPVLDGYDVDTNRSLKTALSSRNARVNQDLKKITKKARLPHFSFHIARHSFADLARKRGWSVYNISKMLGHANIRVTERYLKGFDQDDLDLEMSHLFI